MEMISGILQKIADLNISAAAMGGVAVALEFVLRMIKSEKPLGILHAISGTISKVSGLVALLAKAIANVAALTDKVLPQKLK